MSTEKNRRERRWILPKIQVKLVLIISFVSILTLLLNYQLFLLGLWFNMNRVPAEEIYKLSSLLFKVSVFSILLAVPLSGWVGILSSFKFCGPIHRFKIFFDGLLSGRWDSPCHLRAKDDLHEVKDSINQAISILVDRIRHQHKLLNEAKNVLREPAPDRVVDMVKKIESEEGEFQTRLGEKSSHVIGEVATHEEKQLVKEPVT